MLNKSIKFLIENKLVAMLMLLLFVGWGIVHAPFQWHTGILPSNPVAVDAIPDIGENQQIVFTKWKGRSPQDIDDQITYPLTTSLLGIPGVKTIRSNSMFGFSSIYIIFEEDIEFYWSRSRILEKLNSLPQGLLPEGASPSLGPDATGLGQIFWYTLEGRDESLRGVCHSFTEPPAVVEKVLALGLYVGVSGMVTFRQGDNIREMVGAVDLDRLLVETDSPFLAPVPHRGRPNEPAYVPLVGASVAEVLGKDIREVARRTTANVERLFGCGFGQCV